LWGYTYLIFICIPRDLHILQARTFLAAACHIRGLARGARLRDPLNFSEELVRTGVPSAIDFRATRHGYSYEVVRDVFGDFDFRTQILPVEKALEGLKRMRSIYIKQNLCILGLRGAAIVLSWALAMRCISNTMHPHRHG